MNVNSLRIHGSYLLRLGRNLHDIFQESHKGQDNSLARALDNALVQSRAPFIGLARSGDQIDYQTRKQRNSENTLGTFLRNGLSLLSFHVIHSRDTVASASPSLLTHVFNNHYQNVCYSSLREYFCITSVLPKHYTTHILFSLGFVYRPKIKGFFSFSNFKVKLESPLK